MFGRNELARQTVTPSAERIAQTLKLAKPKTWTHESDRHEIMHYPLDGSTITSDYGSRRLLGIPRTTYETARFGLKERGTHKTYRKPSAIEAFLQQHTTNSAETLTEAQRVEALLLHGIIAHGERNRFLPKRNQKRIENIIAEAHQENSLTISSPNENGISTITFAYLKNPDLPTETEGAKMLRFVVSKNPSEVITQEDVASALQVAQIPQVKEALDTQFDTHAITLRRVTTTDYDYVSMIDGLGKQYNVPLFPQVDTISEIKEQRPDYAEQLLSDLEPTLAALLERPAYEGYGENLKALFTQFADLLAIPRGSGNEREAATYLMADAEKRGWIPERDRYGNVGIVVPASRGYENHQVIVLQDHMDIVDIGENTNQPIEPAVVTIDGKQWIKAKENRSLGGDNAGGVVSAIEAVQMLVNETDAAGQPIPHGPLLLLFTTDEEVGMKGMHAIEDSYTFHPEGQFDQLFQRDNVGMILGSDGDETEKLAIGSLRGERIGVSIPLSWKKIPEGYSAIKLAISGFPGGHSAAKAENPSAFTALAPFLKDLPEDYRILELGTSNTAANAIPQDGFVTLALPDDQLAQLEKALTEKGTVLQEKHEDFATGITISPVVTEGKPALSAESSRNVAHVLEGLAAMQEDVQFTQDANLGRLLDRSINVGIVTMDESKLAFTMLARMGREHKDLIHSYEQPFKDLLEPVSGEYQLLTENPAWEPDPTRDQEHQELLTLHADIFGNEAAFQIVQGGIEVALLNRMFPDALKVSNGAQIVGAHGPTERIDAESIAELFRFNLAMLKKWRDESLPPRRRQLN